MTITPVGPDAGGPSASSDRHASRNAALLGGVVAVAIVALPHRVTLTFRWIPKR